MGGSEKRGKCIRYSDYKLPMWKLTSIIFNSIRYLTILEVLNSKQEKIVKEIRNETYTYSAGQSMSNTSSALKWLEAQETIERKKEKYVIAEKGKQILDNIHNELLNMAKHEKEFTNRVHETIHNKLKRLADADKFH